MSQVTLAELVAAHQSGNRDATSGLLAVLEPFVKRRARVALGRSGDTGLLRDLEQEARKAALKAALLWKPGKRKKGAPKAPKSKQTRWVGPLRAFLQPWVDGAVENYLRLWKRHTKAFRERMHSGIDPDPREAAEDHHAARVAFGQLSAVERVVLGARKVAPIPTSQRDLGQALGVSSDTIRRIEARALAKLQALLE